MNALQTRERARKAHKTGVAGISFFQSAFNRRDGSVQAFFSVFVKTRDGRRRNRRFCLSTLGRAEAWRRALRCRAEHEEKATARAAEAARAALNDADNNAAPIADRARKSNLSGKAVRA
jgi:hypothetical protein